MLTALLLAAAAVASGDVIPVDENCRLVRKPAAAIAKRIVKRRPRPPVVAVAASAPASSVARLFKPRPRARAMLGVFPPPADYELLCDETKHAPPVPATFTPAPDVPYAIAEPEPWPTTPDLYIVPDVPAVPDLYIVPETFEGSAAPPVSQWPVYVPGGPIVVIPGQGVTFTPPVPEPRVWAMLGAGLAALLFLGRRSRHKPDATPVLIVDGKIVEPPEWQHEPVTLHDIAHEAKRNFPTPE